MKTIMIVSAAGGLVPAGCRRPTTDSGATPERGTTQEGAPNVTVGLMAEFLCWPLWVEPEDDIAHNTEPSRCRYREVGAGDLRTGGTLRSDPRSGVPPMVRLSR